MNPITIIVEILALAVGVAAGYFFHRYQVEQRIKNQQDKADNILKGASEQARLIESQARDNATKIIQVAENELKERRIELTKEAERLDKRRSELDGRVDKLEQREQAINKRQSQVKTYNEVHQPDNIETTPSGILLTEDPGSSQQFPVGSTDPGATTARLWYVPFSGDPEVVVKVDQSADGGPTDVDGRQAGALGAWESSGIVDASEAFGPGAFLITVQAGTLWVEQAPGDDNNGDGQADFTYKRSGGQLLLIRIPGL